MSAAESPVSSAAALKMPHRTSVLWRRSTRILEDEIGWDAVGTSWSELLCPQKDIFDVYEEGGWSIDTWIIDGLVRAGSNTLIIGESNVGKTYLALALSVSIASGEPFLTHFDCDTGPVIYMGGEGDKEMLVRRIHNICLGLEINPRDFMK